MSYRDFETIPIRDLRDRDLSISFLASLLTRHELALLLGAGVSIGAGLPNWTRLVEGCESAVGISSPSGRSSQDLMRAIDTVRRRLDATGGSKEMIDLVRENLYSKSYLAVDEYPAEIMQNPMLIAIGAIVMASARGSVGDVFTLNFDDLLEWYLHLHGFKTQVVSEFPTYLRGDVDVTVFHPHGFVPLVQSAYRRSDWLVLSHSELVGRLAASADSPWPTLLGSRFLSKRFLAVGTSMNDLDIDVHLRRARSAFHTTGPLGFVLDVGTSEDRQEALMEIGLVPVVLKGYDEVPDFILSICRKAAAQ